MEITEVKQVINDVQQIINNVNDIILDYDNCKSEISKKALQMMIDKYASKLAMSLDKTATR